MRSGMQGREGLGRHFREHEDERCEHEWHEGKAEIPHEPDRDQGGDRDGQEIHQIVAEQDEPDQAIRTFEQGVRAPCASVCVLGEVAQPIAVQRHHRGFGAGKACGQHDQHEERRDQET